MNSGNTKNTILNLNPISLGMNAFEFSFMGTCGFEIAHALCR